MEMVVWFNIVNCPIIVFVIKVTSREIVVTDLNNLASQTHCGLESHCPIKPLSPSIVIVDLENARNTEPNVIGQVP
jgi:hypothetical protein